MESNAMNLTEYLAKWQGLTERQRGILTAVALGYDVADTNTSSMLYTLYSASGLRISISYDYRRDAWKECPHFTRFNSDCGAFVEVWENFRRMSDKSHHESRIAFAQEYKQSTRESCNAYHYWTELSDNPADALCCAYVWARLQEEPELWQKFEEAIG